MTPSTNSKSSGPLAVSKSALNRSRRLGVPLGTELEAYAEFGRTTTVKVFGGKIESAVTAEPLGLGVRAIASGGRVGFAYTADISDAGIDSAILEAVANSGAAGSDPYQALPAAPSSYPALADLWRPGVGSTGLDRKAAIALEAEEAALAQPGIEIVETCEYMDGEERVAIASSKGVEAEGEHSFCFSYAYALAGGEGERQAGLGFTMGREPAELSPSEAGVEAADKARALLGAAPCSTGSYTVVFDRMTAAALLGVVASAFSAEAVQKGRSVFVGKVGQQVGSELVSLLDDGLIPDGPSTSPFDGEGMPQHPTVLLENGVLRQLLHSSYTARKEGSKAASTGNASRGSYRSLPGVGSTNLVLAQGEGSLQDLLKRVGAGLYVESLAGLHSGVNPVTGEISVGVTGRLIEAGEAGRAVREVTIATDFISLLRSVSDIAADARWIPVYGSVFTPSFAVQGVAVSGK